MGYDRFKSNKLCIKLYQLIVRAGQGTLTCANFHYKGSFSKGVSTWCCLLAFAKLMFQVFSMGEES